MDDWTMTTTSSAPRESSQNDTNITGPDLDVLSDIEEDLTFSQLINRCNDDSMFSTSLLDDSNFEDTPSYQSTIEDDTTCTHSLENNHVT